MHTFFHLDTQPSTVWKNGAGLTQQLVAWPLNADSDRFDARVSVAEFHSEVPFSVFTRTDRHMTLISETGFTLHGCGTEIDADSVHLNQRWDMYEFRGEVAHTATVHGAAVRVLNVMTQRGQCTAHVAVHHQRFELQKVGKGLLLSFDGPSACNGQIENTLLRTTLGPNAGVWWTCQTKHAFWQVDPMGSSCISVVIQDVA